MEQQVNQMSRRELVDAIYQKIMASRACHWNKKEATKETTLKLGDNIFWIWTPYDGDYLITVFSEEIEFSTEQEVQLKSKFQELLEELTMSTYANALRELNGRIFNNGPSQKKKPDEAPNSSGWGVGAVSVPEAKKFQCPEPKCDLTWRQLDVGCIPPFCPTHKHTLVPVTKPPGTTKYWGNKKKAPPKPKSPNIRVIKEGTKRPISE